MKTYVILDTEIIDNSTRFFDFEGQVWSKEVERASQFGKLNNAARYAQKAAIERDPDTHILFIREFSSIDGLSKHYWEVTQTALSGRIT